MKRIRIGKDITIAWRLTIGGESVDLSHYDLSLCLCTTFGVEIPLDFAADNDVLIATFFGKAQDVLDRYRITCWLNKGSEGQSVVDECEAFELVPFTCMEGGEDDNDLSTESIEIEGNINTSAVRGIKDIVLTSTEGLTDTYTITYTDGTTHNYEVTNGAQGERGEKGDRGAQGEPGIVDYSLVYTKQQADELLDGKQDTLTAGVGIDITGNVIRCTLDTELFIVVASLPVTGVENKIYLVPSEETETGNVYTEYLWKNNAWERFGEYKSEVDLTPYIKTVDADARYATADTPLSDIHITQSGGYYTLHFDNEVGVEIDYLTLGDGLSADTSGGNRIINVRFALTVDDSADSAAKPASAAQVYTFVTEALSDYYTKSEVNTSLNAKQDVISDLAAIRSGASAGATAVQSEDLAEVATSGSYDDLTDKPTIPVVPANVSAFTNDAGYLTQHQDLSGYYTKSQTDTLLTGKQDNINDLTQIRNNASLGATAVQPADLTTALATKQNKLIAGNGINIDDNNVIYLDLDNAENVYFPVIDETTLEE